MSRPSHRHSRADASAGIRHASSGVLVGLVVSAGLAVAAGIVTPHQLTLLGLLAVVPFLAAVVSTSFGTGVAGVIAAATTAMMGDYAHATGNRGLLAVLGGVIVATVIAMFTAGVKGRRQRQLTSSREIADVVQQTLLRPVPDDLDGLTIAAHYASASRGAQVGGDLYDVLATPYGVRAFIGDVRGKGLAAVRLAGATLGAFREWAYQAASLADLAAQLDASVARNADAEEFVTAVFLQIEDGRVELVNCGHPAPLLLTEDTVTPVDTAAPSLPLGLGITAAPQHLRLDPGSQLLLYTDGVSDARRRGKFFDVAKETAKLRDRAPDQMVRHLHRRLVKFTRRRLDDDVAILLIARDASAMNDFDAFAFSDPAQRDSALR